ncbi:MAG: hypothetical protein RLZZ187_2593 [Pseudomonadota bacterium]
MEKTPTDPPPPRANVIDVLLLTFAVLMALVLVANLVDFGRLVFGWGGHC